MKQFRVYRTLGLSAKVEARDEATALLALQDMADEDMRVDYVEEGVDGEITE